MSRRLDRLLRVALASALFTTSAVAQAQTEIQWWHSMGGALGDALNGLAEQVQRQPEGLQGRHRCTRARTRSR